MLFLLTGGTQIGKTRWLQRYIESAEARGGTVSGIVSPGIWREKEDGSGLISYEKLGIACRLLPQHVDVKFASRRDLVEDVDPSNQSVRAGLGWMIDEAAIARVNEHFDELAHMNFGDAESMLVVDELGQLELVHGAGFTSALALLEQGPTSKFPNAIVVVRESLLPQAHRLFDAAWRDVRELSPRLAEELLR